MHIEKSRLGVTRSDAIGRISREKENSYQAHYAITVKEPKS